jgi:hypothetical protein
MVHHQQQQQRGWWRRRSLWLSACPRAGKRSGCDSRRVGAAMGELEPLRGRSRRGRQQLAALPTRARRRRRITMCASFPTAAAVRAAAPVPAPLDARGRRYAALGARAPRMKWTCETRMVAALLMCTHRAHTQHTITTSTHEYGMCLQDKIWYENSSLMQKSPVCVAHAVIQARYVGNVEHTEPAPPRDQRARLPLRVRRRRGRNRAHAEPPQLHDELRGEAARHERRRTAASLQRPRRAVQRRRRSRARARGPVERTRAYGRCCCRAEMRCSCCIRRRHRPGVEKPRERPI